MKVAVLIPVYNEEGTIKETITAIQGCEWIEEIVVINDGSTDNTAYLVNGIANVTLLNLSKNVGKGGALNAGWSTTSAEIYLLLDGDLGSSARCAIELLPPLLEDRADMTVARFGLQQSGDGKAMGFGLVRRFATFGIKLLTGEKIVSPLSGQRAIKGRVLDELGGFFPGFGVEIGLTVGALHYGYRLQEIALPISHRAYGRGMAGIVHRGRQLGHILRAFALCLKKGWRE